MTVKPWHILLPLCLAVAIFNWGFAFWLWLAGWWVSHIIFGSLSRPIFRDFGVEPPPRIPDNYDDTDGSGSA